MKRITHTTLVAAAGALLLLQAQGEPEAENPYTAWSRGPSADPAFFPIAVWLQSPHRVARYRAAGINTYVGLWKGPTEAQLAALQEAGIKVICAQNDVGLKHLTNPTIIGWMHGDEPDNAQSLGPGKGYGPPVPPAQIVGDYGRMRATDPSRPILLNLGQGVAWDNWHGRGTRTRHPEDYPLYVEGGDIVSYDIYPAAHSHPEVAGRLWYVARGVERLVDWTRGRKTVWNCIECTRIHNPDRKPTPHEVRAEVWMSLIHGSKGIIYFVHEWAPRFNEAALLDDPEMLAGVTRLNRQVLRLAPVLNRPARDEAVRVVSEDSDHPVAVTARRHDGDLYLFAVNLRGTPTSRTFALDADRLNEVEVIDEDRRLPVEQGRFADRFGPWDVHLYRCRTVGTETPAAASQ